jgi:hypothetical protein
VGKNEKLWKPRLSLTYTETPTYILLQFASTQKLERHTDKQQYNRQNDDETNAKSFVQISELDIMNRFGVLHITQSRLI